MKIVLFLTWFKGDKTNDTESENDADVWMLKGFAVGAIVFIIVGLSMLIFLYVYSIFKVAEGYFLKQYQSLLLQKAYQKEKLT